MALRKKYPKHFMAIQEILIRKMRFILLLSSCQEQLFQKLERKIHDSIGKKGLI